MTMVISGSKSRRRRRCRRCRRLETTEYDDENNDMIDQQHLRYYVVGSDYVVT